MGFDYIAAAIAITAAYVVGNKNRIGFAMFVVAEICWIAYVLISKTSYGILICAIPALVVNARNFWKWTVEECEEDLENVHIYVKIREMFKRR